MIVELIILALATWRISHLFTEEDGPWDVFVKIRLKIGMEDIIDENGTVATIYSRKDEKYSTRRFPISFWQDLFSCMRCMSIWVGIFLTIIYSLFPHPTILIALPFCLSTGALLIDNYLDGG